MSGGGYQIKTTFRRGGVIHKSPPVTTPLVIDKDDAYLERLTKIDRPGIFQRDGYHRHLTASTPAPVRGLRAARCRWTTTAVSVEFVVTVFIVFFDVVPVLVHVHRAVELGQFVGQQSDVRLQKTQFQRYRLSDELPVFALVPATARTTVFVTAAIFGRGPTNVTNSSNKFHRFRVVVVGMKRVKLNLQVETQINPQGSLFIIRANFWGGINYNIILGPRSTHRIFT